jgi:hypothetical protein
MVFAVFATTITTRMRVVMTKKMQAPTKLKHRLSIFKNNLLKTKKVVFLQADISREFGTTIRQVRAEAYRFSTTAARISRQIKKEHLRVLFL